MKIRNPDNPFSEEPEEEVTYSRDLACLTTDFIEIPRTVFHYVKRTNRTIKTKQIINRLQRNEQKSETCSETFKISFCSIHKSYLLTTGRDFSQISYPSIVVILNAYRVGNIGVC